MPFEALKRILVTGGVGCIGLRQAETKHHCSGGRSSAWPCSGHVAPF